MTGAVKWTCYVVLAAYLVVATLGWLIAPHGESEIVGGVWMTPSRSSWLGTDMLGRDMLSRLLVGGQRTLLLALVITFLSLVLGGGGGILAGAKGGLFDTVASRLNDIILGMPSLIVALLALSVMGSSQPILIAVITLIESTRFFRVARALAMEIGERDFVEVAVLRGENVFWITKNEVLPNIADILAVETMMRFTFIILFISSLSFLGLGVQPPLADLGTMVRENAVAVNFGLSAPLLPAAMIAILAVTTNILADVMSVKSPPNGAKE